MDFCQTFIQLSALSFDGNRHLVAFILPINNLLE